MARMDPRVVIFTCNWNAQKSLEEAGKQRLSLPPGVRPLKVDCVGQIGSGLILKSFQKGADGVMLVGCAAEECRYEFGSSRAEELFDQVRKLARLLGILEDRLEFRQVRAGEGTDLIGAVQGFVDRLAAQKEA